MYVIPRLWSSAVLRLGRLTSIVRFPRSFFSSCGFPIKGLVSRAPFPSFSFQLAGQADIDIFPSHFLAPGTPNGGGHAHPWSFTLACVWWLRCSGKVPSLLGLQQIKAWAQPNPALNSDPAATGW